MQSNGSVIGRFEYDGQQPDMIGKTVVGSIVSLKNLLLAGLHFGDQFFLFSFQVELAFEPKERFPLSHYIPIGASEMAFSHT